MERTNFVGHTLDDKYKIESELGRGGMGTVYLATHLGTERPVAVKIIAPQFMERPEFVERFRREARAAGRLRHPNVVNVTDFGFSHTDAGQVAYLVMEYLDGCTLGEILEEEMNLPVGWTLDILEQVCSAVHEAHEQGIIHRDLKPDNIWLEPNQRGGYTVKVLDFGIAKLEEAVAPVIGARFRPVSATPTISSGGNSTFADFSSDQTLHDSKSPTRAAESAATAFVPENAGASKPVIQSHQAGSEDGTLLLPLSIEDESNQDTIGTRIITESPGVGTVLDNGLDVFPSAAFLTSSPASDLTRAGSVLGTPLYMSPEQCRGDRLDARSDIYSLGVIAYQMLSGGTPFSGDFTDVMHAHQELPPPPLNAKKVRKKLKRVIGTALAKNPDDRPQTAEALASILRSRSEGIFGLLRRSGMIYTAHMPKFLMLSAFFHLPMIVLTVTLIALTFFKASEMISRTTANVLIGINATLLGIVSAFCAYLIIGTITWIVTQSMAVPLRPIRIRPALREARAKWKTFAGTGVLSTVLSVVIGALTCGIGFVVTNILWMLLAPVVMMENMRGRPALKRSKDLVKRSLATSAAAFIIMFLIPAVSAGLISFVVNISAKALESESSRIQIVSQQLIGGGEPEAQTTPPAPPSDKGGETLDINIGNNRAIRIDGREKDMGTSLKDAVFESLLQILLLPLQIVTTSFTAIIVALLYLKTRQAAGEPLQDLLAKFEETEHPRKKWQERVRQRLIQSGRITSRS